jgi:hypothetical protein
MQYPSGSAELAFARLFLFGPVLYIGLFMIVDPVASSRHLNKIANSVWKLEASLFHYQDAHRDRDFVTDSFRMRAAIRLAGLLVSLCAMGHVLGLA